MRRKKGDGYLVCWIFFHILVALVVFFRFVVYTTNIYLVGLCVCVWEGERGGTNKYLRSFSFVGFHKHTPF